MNALWQKWIEMHGGSLTDSGELQLPGEQEQIAAVRQGNAWTPLTDYGLLRISGEDAATFLQGQFSNDVRLLDDGQQAQYGSYSTAKGRMLASFLLWRQGDLYYLMLSRDLVADTVKRLSMFVLRAKVKIVDVSDEMALLSVLGSQTESLLGLDSLPTLVGAVSVIDGLTLIRMGDGALLAVGEADVLRPLCERLNPATAVGSNAWRLLDLCAGVVWVRAANKEGFVPQMANMDVIGAVSFTKGCYPGQEVVARAQYRGQIKRHLYRITSAQPLAAGDELISAETGEQAIGLLADVCQLSGNEWQALAVVQDAAWDSGVFVKSRPEQTVHHIGRQTALIRPFNTTDQQRVLDIWLAASRVGHLFLGEDDLQGQYTLVRDEYLTKSRIAVATRQGELLGFIGLLDDFIGGLFVDPAAHGTGVGGTLVAYAKTVYEQLSVEVYAQNDTALAFYAAQGFQEDSRRAHDDQGRPLELVNMVWQR